MEYSHLNGNLETLIPYEKGRNARRSLYMDEKLDAIEQELHELHHMHVHEHVGRALARSMTALPSPGIHHLQMLRGSSGGAAAHQELMRAHTDLLQIARVRGQHHRVLMQSHAELMKVHGSILATHRQQREEQRVEEERQRRRQHQDSQCRQQQQQQQQQQHEFEQQPLQQAQGAQQQRRQENEQQGHQPLQQQQQQEEEQRRLRQQQQQHEEDTRQRQQHEEEEQRQRQQKHQDEGQQAQQQQQQRQQQQQQQVDQQQQQQQQQQPQVDQQSQQPSQHQDAEQQSREHSTQPTQQQQQEQQQPAEAPNPELTVKAVRITVYHAKNLRDADWFGGKSDAYCVCEVRGKGDAVKARRPSTLSKSSSKSSTKGAADPSRFRTKIDKGSNPVWNHEEELDYQKGDDLMFTVLDEDWMKAPDLLGKGLLTGAQLESDFDGELKLTEAGKNREAFLKVKVTLKMG